ncbi:MAG TPA: hypothetical protein VGI03_05690 [Verrucomicrobiae bacterium]|jgi:hypothetical protein
MKANQLAALVLRLLGIYLLLESSFFSLSPMSTLFIFLEEGWNITALTKVLVLFLGIVLPITIGILLIIKAVPLGERLTRQITNDENIVAVSFEQVQVVAFAVVGALIFAGALPQLLNSVWTLLFYLDQTREKTQYPTSQLAEVRAILTAIGIILKAGLGLWMFFRAQGFVNFWRSMRSLKTE